MPDIDDLLKRLECQLKYIKELLNEVKSGKELSNDINKQLNTIDRIIKVLEEEVKR